METLAALPGTYCRPQKSMQSYGCLWVAICGHSALCQYSQGARSVLEGWWCHSGSCTFRSQCGDLPNKDNAANRSSDRHGAALRMAVVDFSVVLKPQVGDFIHFSFACIASAGSTMFFL